MGLCRDIIGFRGTFKRSCIGNIEGYNGDIGILHKVYGSGIFPHKGASNGKEHGNRMEAAVICGISIG